MKASAYFNAMLLTEKVRESVPSACEAVTVQASEELRCQPSLMGLRDGVRHNPSGGDRGQQKHAAADSAITAELTLLFCDEPAADLGCEWRDNTLGVLLPLLNRGQKKSAIVLVHDFRAAGNRLRLRRMDKSWFIDGSRSHA